MAAVKIVSTAEPVVQAIQQTKIRNAKRRTRVALYVKTGA